MSTPKVVQMFDLRVIVPVHEPDREHLEDSIRIIKNVIMQQFPLLKESRYRTTVYVEIKPVKEREPRK